MIPVIRFAKRQTMDALRAYGITACPPCRRPSPSCERHVRMSDSRCARTSSSRAGSWRVCACTAARSIPSTAISACRGRSPAWRISSPPPFAPEADRFPKNEPHWFSSCAGIRLCPEMRARMTGGNALHHADGKDAHRHHQRLRRGHRRAADLLRDDVVFALGSLRFPAPSPACPA